MSNLRVDAIKDECQKHNIKFRQGKFKNGAKYRLSIILDEERFVWACTTLKMCKEAIAQAAYLKEFIPME